MRGLLDANNGCDYGLHQQHLNPMSAKALRTIAFGRCYLRAEVLYPSDRHVARYLGAPGGYGVFWAGYKHPLIGKTLVDFMAQKYPNPLLSALLAQLRLAARRI